MSSRGGDASPKIMGSPLMTIKNELLHGAVVRGELPTVRRLLDRHKADINTKNSNGIGCLQLAILNGHSKLAEFLVQRGIDLSTADPEGYTALHDAAVMDNTLLVHKLISKGLSPLQTTAMGELVIDVAGSTQMEKQLCEEMFNLGEVRLARQYYIYLGLDRDEHEKTSTHDSWRSLLSRSGNHAHPPRSHQKHAMSSSNGPKSSYASPKLEAKAKKLMSSQSDSQVSRNIPTHADRIHPSARSANLADDLPSNSSDSKAGIDRQASSRLGPLPNYPLNEPGNHKNPSEEEVEAYKVALPGRNPNQSASSDKPRVRFETDSEESSISSGCGDLSSSPDSPPSLLVRPTGSNRPRRELLSRTSCESNQNRSSSSNLSPKQARESAAIKALQQHSSFQLQIGLSLQSEQFSTLEEISEEDPFAEDQFTSLASTTSAQDSKYSSPRLATCNSTPSIQQDWFLSGQQQQQHRGNKHTSAPKSRRVSRPLRKTVSFADLPMTRSKPMFVGHSSNQSSSGGSPTASSTAEKKETRRTSSLSHNQSLSASNILDRYITNYNPQRGKTEGSEETDSMFDAGIRALRLKPRKSSMSMRRHNSESGLQRRRSVTFQPEVLLQEIVTDGDVKAVSEILESGMIEDVNKMSPSGLTALHQSAIDGNLECAKTLVKKGADVNCTDCENWTPLHAAVMNGSLEFVRFLLASGAKPNLKNDAGETAYDMAKNGPIRKMLLHAMNGRSPDADEFSDVEYSGEEEEEEYSHAESESDDELEAEGSGLFDSSTEEKTSLKERLGLTHTAALNNVNEDSITPSPDLDNVFSGTQIYHRREHELTDSTSSYGSMFEADEQDKTVVVSSNEKTGGKNCNTESDTDKISESGISTMEGSSDCSHRSRVLSSEDEAITLDSDLDPDSLD